MPNTQHDPKSDHDVANKQIDQALGIGGTKSEGAEYTNCPECGNPTDNGHDRCLPPNPYVCSQCEAMSEGAEWEREFDNEFGHIRPVNEHVPAHIDQRDYRDLKAFTAQERQQAVAEFAREVVARVERMNGEPGDMGIHGGRDRLISKAAVLSILKQRGIDYVYTLIK